MEKLYTVKDLMQLGISRDTAYQLMHSKAFPSVKIGGRYYVTEDAWESWLKQYQYKQFSF